MCKLHHDSSLQQRICSAIDLEFGRNRRDDRMVHLVPEALHNKHPT